MIISESATINTSFQFQNLN